MTYISVYNTDERVYTDERVTGPCMYSNLFHFSYMFNIRDAHQDMVKIGDLGGSSNRIN